MLVKDAPALDAFLPHEYQSQVQNAKDKAASISASDMLGDEKERKKPQKVSLSGRAGIGKSTTMQWLARLWASSGWASGFKVLFLLQLRMLAVSDCQVTTIELLSMFGLFQLTDTGLMSIMGPWLKCSASKVIIFIDGLDEVAAFAKRLKTCRRITDLNQKAHPIELCLNILRGDLLPGCTVVSTSRPFTGLSELKSDKRFEVMGFTETDIKQFVERRHSAKAKEVMSVLHKSPLLMSVCGIAFYCALVSSLLVEGVVFVDEDLQTYSRLISFILVQYVSRKLPEWPFVMEVKSYFPKLAKLAYNGIFTDRQTKDISKVVFDEYDMCQADLTIVDIRSVQNAGLLQTKSVKSGGRHSAIAEFFHLSVQEMLAAAYLVVNPLHSEDLFLDLISGGQFSNTLLYLFGLQYDITSRWVKDIRFSVDPSKSDLDGNVHAHFSALLDSLCMQCGEIFRDKLQICQLLYEGCKEEQAKAVGRFIAPGGKLNMSDTQMTIIDIMAVRFVCKYVANMTEISIERNRFNESMFGYLASVFLLDHVETLTTLKLANNKIGPSSATALAEWLKQSHALEVLELNDNNLGDDEVKAVLEGLHHCNYLQHLNLSGNDITNSRAEELAHLLHNTSTIQNLDVSHNKIGNDGMKVLSEALCHNRTLLTLNISVNSFKYEGVQYVAEVLRQNNILEELDVHGIHMRKKNAAIPLAEALHDNTSLCSLNVANNGLSEKDAKAFAKALQHNTNLQTLNIGVNDIGQDGLDAFAEDLHHNKTLQNLNLHSNGCNFPTKVFTALLVNRCLLKLDLSALNYVPYLVGRELHDALIVNNTLKELHMNECKDGFIPVELFEVLHQNRTLQVLSLSGNKLGLNMVQALSRALLNNVSLQVLDVSRNGFGDKGVECLADALHQNRGLRQINITNNNIFVSGGKSLAKALCVNSSLHMLNLSLNNICNNGAVALANMLLKNSTLQVLDVRMNGIRGDGQRALAEAKQRNKTLRRLIQ